MKKIFLLLTVLFSTIIQGQTCIQFNGTNAYIRYGNNPTLGLSNFTLECWFKRLGGGMTTSTGTGGVTAVPLITKGRGEADASNVDMNYFLGIRQTDSTLVADFEEGATGTTPGLNHPIIGVTKLARNVWYHVAVTYDNSSWKLYLNGVLENTIAVNQPVQNLSIQHSAIGSALTSSGAAQGFFNGQIDEARIWNNARTQTQIIGTINSAIASPSTGMVARWGLNEGTGTAIGDISGNNVTGTVTSTNWSWITPGAPFNINIPPSTPILVSPANSSKCHGSNVMLTVTANDFSGDSLWVKFYGRKKNNAKDFSIIPLPDTQYYTSHMNGGSNYHYKSQMNWVNAKKDSLNIKFITGLGDCVENGDNAGNDIEWKRADTSMKIIETNTTIVMPYGIPYGLNVGNHDQSPNGNPSGTTTFYNQYFGTTRFSSRYYWGGNYGANADNNYQLYTAEGMDFIQINLEYDPAANAAVLAWADNLLKAYPTRRGIVSSHYFLDLSGSFGAQGLATYNYLKNNPNFILMLCGHVAGEARRSDVFNGRTVHCVMSDYQARTNGGNGWIRIMKFKPSQNKIDISTYSPTLKLSETDADSQFSLNVDFGGPWGIIDSVKVAAGQNASVVWPGLLPSTDYEWYATSYDGTSVTSTQIYNLQTTYGYTVTLPADVVTCGGPVNVTPTSLCAGGTYTWMTGANTSSLAISSTTMAILNVTDSLGCVSKDTMNISINNIPVQPSTVSGITNFCTGTSGTTSYSIAPVSGATGYSWNLPGTWTGTSTTNNINVTIGTSSGIMSVTASNSCGISPAQTLNLNINTLPTLTISGINSICIGDPVNLNVSGANSYIWNTSATTFSITDTPTINTTYSVNGTDVNGCTNSSIVSVTVNALPVVNLSSSNNFICTGNSATLTAAGASTYTWNTTATTTNISVTPTLTTTYSVSGTDSNGCMNSAMETVTVNPLPIININSTGSAFCVGNSATLTASGASTYTWSTSSNSTNIVVTPTATTSYSVNGTDANGCMNSAIESVTVNALPVLNTSSSSTLICVGQTATLNVTGANTYTWSTSTSGPNIVINPNVTTIYTVTGTDANGCDNSIAFTQSVSACTGVNMLGNNSGIRVYPNPNNGEFSISVTSVSENTFIEIYNLAGQLIMKEQLRELKTTVDLKNKANGIYTIRITEKNDLLYKTNIIKQ